MHSATRQWRQWRRAVPRRWPGGLTAAGCQRIGTRRRGRCWPATRRSVGWSSDTGSPRRSPRTRRTSGRRWQGGRRSPECSRARLRGVANSLRPNTAARIGRRYGRHPRHPVGGPWLPPIGLPLPPARTASWAAARESLEAALRQEGCSHRVRSAASLWGAAQGGTAPRGATWGDLCERQTLESVRRALEAARSPAGGLRAVTWNLRWAVDPHTPKAVAKRAVVLKAIRGGCAVALQETHWGPDGTELWAALLPGAQLLSTAARAGPLGGPQGGVAVALPEEWTVLETATIVAGRAMDVTFLRTATARPCVMRVVYLPPEDRAGVLRLLADAPPPGDGGHTTWWFSATPMSNTSGRGTLRNCGIARPSWPRSAAGGSRRWPELASRA